MLRFDGEANQAEPKAHRQGVCCLCWMAITFYINHAEKKAEDYGAINLRDWLNR